MDCARVEFSQNNRSLKVNKIVSSTAHFFTYPSSMGGLQEKGGPHSPPAWLPAQRCPGSKGRASAQAIKQQRADRRALFLGEEKSIGLAVVPKGQSRVCIRQTRTVTSVLVVACQHQTCLGEGWSCYRHEG